MTSPTVTWQPLMIKIFKSSSLGIYMSYNIPEPRQSKFYINGQVQFRVKIKLELLKLMEYFQE